MKKNEIFTIMTLIVGFNFYAIAQVPTGSYKSSSQAAYVPPEILNILSSAVKKEPEGVIGTPHLFESYVAGEVSTKNYGNVKGFDLNYDLSRDQLLMSRNGMVRILEAREIDSFWINEDDKSQYLNLTAITNNKLSGVAKILANTIDSIYLVSKINVKLLAPNYSPQFNTGNKKSTWMRKEIDYIISGEDVIKLPTSKKTALKVFGEKSNVMAEFANQTKLKFKNINDWKTAINYYSTLN